MRVILKLWPYDRRYLKGIVALGISTGVLLIINFTLDLAPIFIVLLGVFASYTAFAVMLLALGLNNEDLEFAQLIIGRIKKIYQS